MKFVKDILRITKGWPIKSLYAGVGTILALHRVLPASSEQRIRNHGLEITPEKLEGLILLFKKKGYDFLQIDDLKDRLRSRAKNKFVIFTFDDGYNDNAQFAHPILKSHGVPFVIYLTNSFLKRKQIIWWYALEHLLLTESWLTFSFDGHNYSFEASSFEQKNFAFNELRKLFLKQNREGLERLINLLFKKIKDQERKYIDENLLKVETISELNKDELVTFGAHTINHLTLNTLEKSEFIDEVQSGRDDLENILGFKINHFSYPYGSKNEVGQREFEWMKELHFDTAVTGRPGNLQVAHHQNLYALPRLYIGQDTSEKEVTQFISGLTPCINGLRHRVMVD